MVSPKPIPRLELSGSRSGSIGARLWMPERQWRAVPALIRLMRHDKANANAGRALAASVKHAAEGKNREHCRVRIFRFPIGVRPKLVSSIGHRQPEMSETLC